LRITKNSLESEGEIIISEIFIEREKKEIKKKQRDFCEK